MRIWAREIGRLLRGGLPALAVYALLLQAFFAGAAPAAPFDPANAPLCAEMAAGGGHSAPGQPGGHGGHDCLCLAQCAAPHAAAALLGGVQGALAPRVASLTPLSPAADAPLSSRPIDRGPGARAPPRG